MALKVIDCLGLNRVQRVKQENGEGGEFARRGSGVQ
jgi:hypothetical protein